MNMRLKKLEDRKAALVKHSESILNTASEEDRDYTDEEQRMLDANEKDLESVAAGIKRELVQAGYSKPSMAWEDTEETISRVSITNPKPAFEDDPNKGFKSPREFFTSIMSATENGGTDDARLKFLSGKRSGFQAAVGSDEQGTYSDPYGGFLVPVGFMPNLLSIQAEADPTASRTTKIPMSAPSVEIPARTDTTHTTSVSGGLRVYRRSETQTVTASRMATEQVKLTAHPLMGVTYATEELLTDSVISFVALLEAGFKDEFASKLVGEKLSGTGVGEMEGVLNSPCLVSVTAETGQDADSIVYENVIKMRSRCWRYQDSVWMYNHDCLPQLMQLVMTIGTSGVPMWQNSAREGEPDMLLGRPAFPTEYCPTVGDAGDLLLGNWSQYLEGTYQPLQSAESMHVRFLYNERTFRFTMRNDGRCWWRTYLTPKNSTATLSPFVVIAARA